MRVTTHDGILVRGTAAQFAHLIRSSDECLTVTDRQARRITKRIRQGR